jgi:beta-phosphoglucomutase family hydrolase
MNIPIDARAKAFIFDIDGTLADTMDLHYQAWHEVALKAGFDFTEKEYYTFAGTPTFKIVQMLNERHGLSFDQSTVDDKEKAFEKRLSEVKPIEQVVRIAREYKGKVPMSLGTGGIRYHAEITMKAIDLEGFFDILVCAEDVKNHKPFPDTFLECARRMNVDPKECLVFEDGELGLEAARRGGMIPLDVRPYLK